MFTGVQISEIVYWLKLEYIGDALCIQVSVKFLPPMLILSLSLEFSGKCSHVLRNQYQ